MKIKQTLSLVMIVKNEEKGLKRAVYSVKDFVDEIIIAVDNASIDKTLEIAKTLTSNVKSFDWSDSYAEARNFAQEGAKSDWLLFLDGHEYVTKCEKLQDFLNLDVDGLVVDIDLEGGSVIRNPRIYKNGLKFEQAVHELQNIKKPCLYPFFKIKHGRSDGQAIEAVLIRDKQRDDEVPRLLGAELKKNPRHLRALFHLGMHAQSKQNYKLAIKYFKRYLKYSKFKGERWFIGFNLALCQMGLGHNFRAFWAVNNADLETPGRWEVDKLKGLVYFQAKKYQKALDCFTNSFRINTIDCPYKPWPRDEASTWNIIGESFFNLKRYYQAYLAFHQASVRATEPQLKELAEQRSKLMYEITKKTA